MLSASGARSIAEGKAMFPGTPTATSGQLFAGLNPPVLGHSPELVGQAYELRARFDLSQNYNWKSVFLVVPDLL